MNIFCCILQELFRLDKNTKTLLFFFSLNFILSFIIKIVNIIDNTNGKENYT